MEKNEIKNRHIWEGWTVYDFINSLEIEFEYEKHKLNKDNIAKWCTENQPYYKKRIPEVIEYFKSKL